MRFWCGVSAIAGALRRKVWIDQITFKWYPNFYIILVAPPGVVSKTTTASVAMGLLRRIDGIRFGPDVVTWEALVGCFENARETFEFQGMHHTMSSLTLQSGEFGNLLDPQNRAMVDMYVKLWDGSDEPFSKVTKTSGDNLVVAPWINMIACTTPAWIAGSFPEYMIGGGFTSRSLFVYAEKKEMLIANPRRHVTKGRFEELGNELVEDLKEISQITGEYVMTEAALDWTDAWYERHWAAPPPHLTDERFQGYLARKQTHMYKLAMVLAAARGNELRIDVPHFEDALAMIESVEPDMTKVFARIGQSEEAANAERLLNYIRKNGPVNYEVVFQHVRLNWPKLRDFEQVLFGLIQMKLVTLIQGPGGQKILTAA